MVKFYNTDSVQYLVGRVEDLARVISQINFNHHDQTIHSLAGCFTTPNELPYVVSWYLNFENRNNIRLLL